VEALRQVRCLDLRDALRSPGCNELAADALAVLALAGRHLALPTPPALLRALGALLEPGAAPPRLAAAAAAALAAAAEAPAACGAVAAGAGARPA